MPVGNNLPPGCYERDPHAPWNRRESEPTFIVQEWVPPTASRKGYWARVDAEDFDLPHEVDAETLLAKCQATNPEVRYSITEDG